MNRKFLLTAALTMSSVLIPMASVTTAHAQSGDKDKALSVYRKGRIQYDLGRWEKAIALFEEAYGIFPDAAYLFNIAQSYRQSDDCKQAAFFYKRFLSISPGAPNRREVEGYIQDLDEACRLRGGSNLTQPDTTNDPVNKTGPDVGNPDKQNPDPNKPNNTAVTSDPVSGTQSGVISDDAPPESDKADGPSLLVVHFQIGPSKLALNDAVNENNTPQITSQLRTKMALGLGYPIQAGPLLLDVGILTSFVTIVTSNDDIDPILFSTALANVGARYPVADKIMIHGTFGVGPMFVSGLSNPNNPLSRRDKPSAALTVFAARVALGGEYALTDSIGASMMISLQSAQTHENLIVDNLNSAQALFGVRYSL